MKLISTTDFVLSIRNKTESEFLKEYPKLFHNINSVTDMNTSVMLLLENDAIKFRIIGEYTKFLKRPIELGMFVHCDENGNFLQEPEHYDLWRKHGSFTQYGENLTSICEPFFKAKEKVLFEWFELIEVSKKTKILSHKNKKCEIWINEKNKIDEIIHDFKTIEDFVHFDLELTPNAIKEIGLTI